MGRVGTCDRSAFVVAGERYRLCPHPLDLRYLIQSFLNPRANKEDIDTALRDRRK